jgi:hypothetical protein
MPVGRLLLAVIAVAAIIGCSAGVEVGGVADTEPIDHPVPSTPSILPLQMHNSWTYHYTMYDSSGIPVDFPQRQLVLRIPQMYYIDISGELQPVISRDAASRDKQPYLYCYEWDNLDSGYLVCHKGAGEVEQRGLYIAGTFNGEETELFDTFRLWFPYPAEDLSPWQVDLTGGDSVLSTIECLGSDYDAWFDNPDSEHPSPLGFIDGCYLFRQTIADHVYYHTFHPDYGKISMRCYVNGVLIESYLLQSAEIYR